MFVAGGSGAIGGSLVVHTRRRRGTRDGGGRHARRPGLYNVVDDEPAPVSSWLPALAEAVGAKRPHHAPAWLARLFIGEGGVSMMTAIRGGSNARARRELSRQPAWPTWRRGFVEGLG